MIEPFALTCSRINRHLIKISTKIEPLEPTEQVNWRVPQLLGQNCLLQTQKVVRERLRLARASSPYRSPGNKKLLRRSTGHGVPRVVEFEDGR